ncbi:cell envelope integrity protein CreD [Undibacterium sp. TJN19]|uniref:cell envelope integrity protein CreD n=1 Tax=Undibacterium sp. TJN19 TaxID=3413055 RepID=UPI003BF2B601
MEKNWMLKTGIVGLLAILIYISLMMIQSTIWERMRYREEAVRSITADSVGEQTILGPVLVIPYTETWEEEEIDKTTKVSKIRPMYKNKKYYVYPNDLQIKGNIETDQRYRGIHKVLVYSGTHAINGDFIMPDTDELISKDKSKATITFNEAAYVSFGLSDTRGLRNFPKLEWDGKTYDFRQGSKLSSASQGIHAILGNFHENHVPVTVKFKLDLMLDGVEHLSFVPIARNNQVSLSSNWPHPQYGGRFLPSPKGRTRSDNGFGASWNISSLSSNAQQQLTQLEYNNSAKAKDATPDGIAGIDVFSVAFIEPINVYSEADRAVKYGLMFVALTFAAFFLFEVLKQLPIHPVQYMLVGLALAIFFLLLVSLAEKIGFLRAYLVASIACILLIGFYLSYALHNWKRGLGFGLALTMLYGILFGLLQSESNALVMGSLLLFAVLSAFMIVTRKVDWYQLGKSDPTPAEREFDVDVQT